MILEVTTSTVGAFCGIAGAIFAGGFAIGDLRWYRRKEGTDLERAIAGFTEAVKVANEGKDGLRRVHERIDDLAACQNRILGYLEKGVR